MIETIELPTHKIQLDFAQFQDILLNVNIEANIQPQPHSHKDEFLPNHQTTCECLREISKHQTASIVAFFFNQDKHYLALETLLLHNLEQLDTSSLQRFLFEILQRKKKYQAASLILIHHRIVKQAFLTPEDRWLFKHLRMKFWQQTEYFVNAKDNYLFLEME